jgi:pyridoxamine 5'-phosphate oxidase
MSVDSDFPENPVDLLLAWYRDAAASGQPLPEAMALSTATPDAKPSVRFVLFKGMSQGGLAFYTNYESRKAIELEANPRAASVFYWSQLSRQVRVEGYVERVSETESDAYFVTRDRSSQLGAWASPQSQAIESRAELDARVLELERQYAERPIPRPPFWGGYRLVPERFEFWIGREHRLHDRFEYAREGAVWRVTRLAP